MTSGLRREGSVPAGAPTTRSGIPVQPAAFLTSASNLRFAVQTTRVLHFPTEHRTAKTQICCYYATVGDITETVRAHGERGGGRVGGAGWRSRAHGSRPVQLHSLLSAACFLRGNSPVSKQPHKRRSAVEPGAGEAGGARRCPSFWTRCEDRTRVRWQCMPSSASAGPGARGPNR